MISNRQFRTARATAAAGVLVAAAACADSVAPTGPTLRSAPSMAASGSGGAVVKSMVGLEPLLDASYNLSEALAVSDLGQVVGTSAINHIGGIVDHAVIWDGSTFAQDLGTLPGGSSSSAAAIKSDGSVIVGQASPSGGGQRAVRWVRPNGVWIIDELPMPEFATHCYAVDVASDGSILGACYASAPPRITVWRNGVPIDVVEGIPAAMNGNGQIVGYDVNHESFIWDIRTNPVTVTPLGTLGANVTFAADINDLGDVVGMSQNVAHQSRPFLWTAKKGMVDLGTLAGGLQGHAFAINSAGQVAGTSTTTADGAISHAVIWSKGKITDLGVLGGYDISSAKSLNAKGQLAGYSFSTTIENSMRATLWTVK